MAEQMSTQYIYIGALSKLYIRMCVCINHWVLSYLKRARICPFHVFPTISALESSYHSWLLNWN